MFLFSIRILQNSQKNIDYLKSTIEESLLMFAAYYCTCAIQHAKNRSTRCSCTCRHGTVKRWDTTGTRPVSGCKNLVSDQEQPSRHSVFTRLTFCLTTQTPCFIILFILMIIVSEQTRYSYGYQLYPPLCHAISNCKCLTALFILIIATKFNNP